MTKKHTKGPLIVEHDSGEIYISAPHMKNSSQVGNEIAYMDPRSYLHDEARMLTDANFMVQAWNSHDKLLEACKAIKQAVFDTSLDGLSRQDYIAKTAHSAIAEAEKGSE